MAGSVNQVILMGRLGKDPEVRQIQSGKTVATMTLATDESWGHGEDRKEKTEWHRVVVWGKTAEACSANLSKGSRVFIMGRLTSRQYEDKDGGKRTITEVVATNVTFMGEKRSAEKPADSGEGGGPAENDDSFPF